jgi:hypothetical protein
MASGCSDIHVTQNPDQMRLRTGSVDEVHRAESYADLFLPYALLADQTREAAVYRDGHFLLGHTAYCTDTTSCNDISAKARSILSQWRLVRTWKDPTDFPCKPDRALCTEPLRGLGVQAWVRDDAVCSEAVIAFRGTDPSSLSDWTTYLRWFLPFLPIYDQYDQVQDHARDFVDAIEQDRCFVRGTTRIIATGHSLGGGLAQQAAYVEPRIRHVYAFDPSVVTGSSDARVRQALSETGPGLRIDRIYEHGEALAYLRFAQRQLAPASACNPQIRTIRFDAVHGGPIGQHTLSGLIGGLLRLSGESHHGSRQTTLPDSAECRPAGAIVSASAR